MRDTLRERQEAGQEVEKLMMQFLLLHPAAQELKVGDVKEIAGKARRLAFDIFSEVEAQRG